MLLLQLVVVVLAEELREFGVFLVAKLALGSELAVADVVEVEARVRLRIALLPGPSF